MRSILSSVALVGTLASAAVMDKPKYGMGPGVLSEIPLGFNFLEIGKGVFVKPPPGPIAAQRTVLEPQSAYAKYGAKRVKIRYGPLKMPANTEGKLGLQMEETGGLVWNAPMRNVEVPCSDCYLTYIEGGLEDQMGKELNVNDGTWLHHSVLMAEGKDSTKADATCRGTISLPHMGLYVSPNKAERFAAFANDRLALDFAQSAEPMAGYYLGPKDKVHFSVELMNMAPKSQLGWVTMIYEFIPKASAPTGFLSAKPFWLDVDECGLSDVDAPEGKQQFGVQAKTWTNNINGKLLFLGTHTHDGGKNVIVRNNGVMVCNSTSTYKDYTTDRMVTKRSELPGGGAPAAPPMAGMETTPSSTTGDVTIAGISYPQEIARAHMAGQEACEPSKFAGAPLWKVGDKIDLEGFYDFERHPGSLTIKGTRSPVMVLAVGMIGTDPKK